MCGVGTYVYKLASKSLPRVARHVMVCVCVPAQVDPTKYRGLISGMKTVVAEEGVRAVWKGWLPTAIGYSVQGMAKFGLNEIFKDGYSNAVGEDNALR